MKNEFARKLKWPIVLFICLYLIFPAESVLAKKHKINNSRQLGSILRFIEKQSGQRLESRRKTRNITMRLQIHIEDAYLSVGSSVNLDDTIFINWIIKELKEGKSRTEVSNTLIKKFERSK